ncbi:MAG TPA: NUDIX domain-containing protein [Planctomycetota bacterium]|nr:NUDIX domain-containing protein [Planctomycetota bacterium]OQC21720.1 MAG: NUDIX domain protein [Planctomycetes bacterium ADurb.Bin069]NMD35840.1 NUDIX domain-containing protein [Planctomycetota bacterium]HNR98900.1 NUDIX domain-containing protein [Planctomycetota bacterium]HNU26025.1 NUDIX domain-containing protein [Planctomycetota bacterium]
MISQAACVPYRRAGDAYEILLITNRKGRWGLPKGIIDGDETPQETVAKEALEEAGIAGTVEEEAIGAFVYAKWGETLRADVYLMEVVETYADFQESTFRRREWLRPEIALARIRNRMYAVLLRAVEILDARFGIEVARERRGRGAD